MRRWWFYFTVLFVVAMAVACSKQAPPVVSPPASKVRTLEGYPSATIDAIQRHQQYLQTASPSNAAHLQSIVSKSRTWSPGHSITVAFEGGSASLRAQIMQHLQPWTEAAGVAFDFGPGAANGVFREWAPTDTSYSAEVRIAFRGGDQGGYWSMVGRDSVNPGLAKPGEPSMNFEGFLKGLPEDWEATVLHEFGHALGFEHEHQSPVAPCETEFRWDDDPGYVQTRDIYKEAVPDSLGRRPGIYTVLENPPNSWKRDQIDFNLRQLPQSADWILSAFDPQSIMKYQFDDWMFTNGVKSRCYSIANLVLSKQDREAAQKVYPRSSPAIVDALNTKQRALQELVQLKGLPSDLVSQYRAELSVVKKRTTKAH